MNTFEIDHISKLFDEEMTTLLKSKMTRPKLFKSFHKQSYNKLTLIISSILLVINKNKNELFQFMKPNNFMSQEDKNCKSDFMSAKKQTKEVEQELDTVGVFVCR